MQTFLTDVDFETCARNLDPKRLNAQVNEAAQILEVLYWKRQGDGKHYPAGCGLVGPDGATPRDGKRIGHFNHPAVRMWEGYEACLWSYATNAIQVRWPKPVQAKRMACDRIYNALRGVDTTCPVPEPPPWWMNRVIRERIIHHHRANLIRKDPEFYGRKWPAIVPVRGYFWPVCTKCGGMQWWNSVPGFDCQACGKQNVVEWA